MRMESPPASSRRFSLQNRLVSITLCAAALGISLETKYGPAFMSPAGGMNPEKRICGIKTRGTIITACSTDFANAEIANPMATAAHEANTSPGICHPTAPPMPRVQSCMAPYSSKL